MQKVDVFFDLDGVLFKYDMDDYIGNNPKYKQEGYFKTRPLDKNAYNLMKKMFDSDEVENVYIASSAIIEGFTIRQNKGVANDKIENIMMHVPWFPKQNIIIATDKTKSETVSEFLNRKISKSDILVDDFNKSLMDWKNASGSPIKYINGINSNSDEWTSIENWHVCLIQKGYQYDILKRIVEIKRKVK